MVVKLSVVMFLLLVADNHSYLYGIEVLERETSVEEKFEKAM